MQQAKELHRLIGLVKGRLQAEEIDFDDYDKAIACLKKYVSPKLCIEIYETYIYY